MADRSHGVPLVSAVISLLLQIGRAPSSPGAVGFLIAFDTLCLASTPVLNGDSDSNLVLKKLLPGFYLWPASFIVIVACGLLGMRRQSRAATADSDADARTRADWRARSEGLQPQPSDP